MSSFASKLTGENFNPHVSTGVARTAYLDQMIAEPFGMMKEPMALETNQLSSDANRRSLSLGERAGVRANLELILMGVRAVDVAL